MQCYCNDAILSAANHVMPWYATWWHAFIQVSEIADVTCLQEPLISSAEAQDRLKAAVLPPSVATIKGVKGTSGSLAVVPLPEGYELSPFSPDVRWKKDRNARKLSSGATAIVYRYGVSLCNTFVH